MTKKILLSLLLAFTLVQGGCTSGDSKSEDGSTDEASASFDGEQSNAEGSGEVAATGKDELDFDKELGEGGGGDLSADLGEESKAPPAEGLPDDALGAASAESAPPPATDLPADAGVPSDAMAAAPPASDPPPSFDSAPPGDAMAALDAGGSPAPKASLKKVKEAPFTAADGTLLNAVYVARKGDTMKSVSQMIYGSERAKDIKKWNPALSKKLKVGDKVYYNSPQRPADNSKMALYYEDMGLPPQVYTSADGDDLKKTGKKLLGNKDSWKELWVTNPNLESKGKLTAGIEIRYWPQDAHASAPVQASGGDMPPPPMPPSDQGAPPPSMADNGMPPPPPPAPPADAPPPPDMAAQGSMEPPALPPPPPPPEPPKAPKAPKADMTAAQGTDPDLLMMLGVGAIVVVGLVLLFVIRKNRSKRMDFGQTQV